jgi:hypothetical protein
MGFTDNTAYTVLIGYFPEKLEGLFPKKFSAIS